MNFWSLCAIKGGEGFPPDLVRAGMGTTSLDESKIKALLHKKIESTGYVDSKKVSMDMQIWHFLLDPIAEHIENVTKENSLLPVFLLENPYPSYANSIYEAISTHDSLKRFEIIALEGEGVAPLADKIVQLSRKKPAGILLMCTSKSALPRQFASLVREDGYLTIPHLNYDRLQAFSKNFHGACLVPESARDWVKWVGPQELIVASTLSQKNWIVGLEQLARQNSMSQSFGTAKKLSDLHGVDSAVNWAKQLFNDIELARNGQITWDEVDKGALLVGPPGTGKTTIAKAIAYEAGVNFIPVAPTSDWMGGDGLHESLAKMSATFSLARQTAPSIVFIDELDSVGNRETFTGHNASYNTDFLNNLLMELDGFESRDQVIVIAATNYPEKVDPALRRSGRLDRIIQLQRPGVDALASLYKAVCSKYPVNITEKEYRECAENSLGLTGADVEVMVRGARRRARLDGMRDICKEDIIAEIYRIPADAERKPLHESELYATACHEAGHALMGLLQPNTKFHVRLASIIPSNDGALGFVASTRNELSETRESLLDSIRVALAGRAAEEIVFGAAKVSTGAGGWTERCDLAVANRMAKAYLYKYGFSEADPNWWGESDDDTEAKALIKQLYDEVMTTIKRNRPKLDLIADELRKCSVLNQAKLLQLISD